MATTTTVADRIRVATQTRFLLGMHNQIIFHQFAQRKTISAGKGGTAQFDKVVPQAIGDFAVAEGSDVTAEDIYTMKVTATPSKHGRAVTRNWEVYLTAEGFQDWKIMANQGGDQAAKYHDRLVADLVATKGYRLRADNDATYQKAVTTTTAGAANGSTFISTGITEASTFWAGGFATVKGLDSSFAARRAFWETGQIATQTTVTCTMETADYFSALIAVGCTIWMCAATGIVATDTLGLKEFGLAVRQLERNEALRFNDAILVEGTPKHREIHNVEPGSGGDKYWAMVYDQDLAFDWMQSEKYVDMAVYQDKNMLINGYPKKYMGCMIFGDTNLYRADVDGTKNRASGAVHPVSFFGQESYGLTQWAGKGMRPPYGVVLNLKEPTDFSDYSLVKASLAWQSFFAKTNLSSHANVQMLCGASA